MATTTLANFWHPLCTSDEVTAEPRRFELLDEFVVAYRDEAGVVALRDLCIHRGAALSLGWVRDGNLVCPYHGWQFDRGGACVRIPSRPADAPIPANARATAFTAAEKYGLVWVAMGDPVSPIPHFPGDVVGQPGWKDFIAYRHTWNTSSARAVENFMDFSHFAYVHTGILGTEETAEIAPYEVEKHEYGLTYFLEQYEPSEFYGSGGTRLFRYEYTLVLPFTIHLKKIDVASGDQTIISQLTCPRTETTTELFVFIVRNHALEDSDDGFGDFTRNIMEQDRPVVESQRPERVPTSLREELHIKVPDAAGLLYRQRLAQLANVEPFGPYGA